MDNNNLNSINPENLNNEVEKKEQVARFDTANLEFNLPVRKADYLRKTRVATQQAEAERTKAKTDSIEAQNYNNFQLWDDAKSLNRVIPVLSNYRKENSFKSDDDFMVDSTLLQENNVPLQYWSEFNSVGSKDQFDYILSNLNTEIETRSNMSKAGGVKNFVFEAAAGMTDPVQIAIGVATAGISGLAKGGSIAAKLGTSFAEGTVEGAITGSLINQGSHTYSGMDIVVDALAGGVLSTGITGAGMAMKKGLDVRAEARLDEAGKIQDARRIANEKKYENDLKDGNDINVHEKLDTSKQVNDYSQSHVANANRQALEEQFYNTPERTQVVDTWRKQNFKALKEIENVENKLNQLHDSFEDALDTGDTKHIVPLRNTISTYEKKLSDLTKTAEKQTNELKAYESLKPIEQMQYMSDKIDLLFDGLNMDDPQLKSKLDMDNIINDLYESEVKNLNAIKSDVSKVKEAGKMDEFDFLSLKLEEQEAKINSLTNPKIEEVDVNVNNGDAGAARNRSKIVNTDSFADQNEAYKFESSNPERTNKIEQEQFDNVHSEVNPLNGALRHLQTISTQLNAQGGKTALFGDLLFGRIATKQNTTELQKRYYEEVFQHADIKLQKEQYLKELNEIEPTTERQAMIIVGKDLHRVNLEGISDVQLAVAEKFNKATKAVYRAYNASNKLSVEMQKNVFQRKYATQFQNLLEKPIDDQISLSRAYKNHFGKNASRNSGFSNARNEMNVMLRIYGMDSEQFSKRYPDLSPELESALSRSDKAHKLIYKDILTEAIESGLDKDGTLQHLLNEGGGYTPIHWLGNTFDSYSKEYGNDQLIALLKGGIEKADPNTKFTRAVKKDIDKGKTDVLEAEVKGKPLSDIYASAIVNHTIERYRYKGVTDKDIADGLTLAMNDMERFFKENEESLHGTMDSEDFLALKAHVSKRVEKSGGDSFTSKKIKMDYFHEMEMEGRTGIKKSISIADFIQLNSEKSMQGYLNTASSKIAFAKSGIDSKDSLDNLMHDVEIHTLEIRDRAKGSDSTPEDILAAKNGLTDEDLKFYKELTNTMWKGQSMIDYNKPVNKTLQYLGTFNFMRVMGKMPIAQFSEWSEVAHQGGLSTMFASMPELFKARKALYNAKGNEVMNFAEAIESVGIINDQFDGQMFNDIGDEMSLTSFDKNSNVVKSTKDRYIQGADDTFHKGARYAGFLGSKMDKITRTMAVRSAFSELDKLARFFEKDGSVDWLARQDKTFTKRGINEDTLTEYGLTLQDLPLIKKAFDDHAVFRTSSITENRIIQGINLKELKQADPKTYELLHTFSVNAANEVVAPSTIGNSYKPLVNSQLMKILFQFQSYPLQSLNTKVRHKFRPNNNVSMYIMLASMTGFASYAMTVLSNAPKYENSEEYLKDRFSMSKVMAGSFSRSVFAWYMPAIMGSVESMALDSHVFNESTRTTGLSQGILSNPTTDLLDSIYNVGKYGAKYAMTKDDNAYQQSIRNAVNILPWASAPLMGPGFQTMAQSGKEYEKK